MTARLRDLPGVVMVAADAATAAMIVHGEVSEEGLHLHERGHRLTPVVDERSELPVSLGEQRRRVVTVSGEPDAFTPLGCPTGSGSTR